MIAAFDSLGAVLAHRGDPLRSARLELKALIAAAYEAWRLEADLDAQMVRAEAEEAETILDDLRGMKENLEATRNLLYAKIETVTLIIALLSPG